MSKSPTLHAFVQMIITDHDRNGAPTEGERFVHKALSEAFRRGYLEGWRAYEQPHLNGDRPDFVLLHPKKGVILLEVKDWNLASPDVQRYQASPSEQVDRYRKNVLRLYLRTFLDLEEAHGDAAFGVIETAVYFHNATRAEAREFMKRQVPTQRVSLLNNVRVLGRDEMRALADGRLHTTRLKTLFRKDSHFTGEGRLEKLIEELEGWMAPVDHTLSRHEPVALTPQQLNQAAPTPGVHRRLRGAAGAGKSLVLASRVAKLLDEGQRVLLLTFNITLQHYLRDLVRQQSHGMSASGIRERLVIKHFHGFLTWVADKHDIALERLPTEEGPAAEDHRRYLLEIGWVRQLESALGSRASSVHPDCRFDAVIIDEGQDFTRAWALFAMRFLTSRDEFLVAFDDLQNVYTREMVWLDSGGDVAGLGFAGPPAELKGSHRLPDVMSRLARRFACQFLGAQEIPGGDERAEQAGLFDEQFHLLAWHNTPLPEAEALTKRAMATVEFARTELGAHPNDIVILAERANVALPIVQALKEEGYRVTHVFDDRGEAAMGDDGYAYRRQQKWRFQPTDGRIKVCTLHSFKGWEAPYVIGVLDAPSNRDADEQGLARRAALVYIGLTRLRRSNDGSSSLFAFANADPRFNAVEDLVAEVNVGQQAVKVTPRRSGTTTDGSS
jgi:superfamily I DNA/RNA helicase